MTGTGTGTGVGTGMGPGMGTGIGPGMGPGIGPGMGPGTGMPPGGIDLATGQCRRFGPSPWLRHALDQASRLGGLDGTGQYYPPGGDPELCALVLQLQDDHVALRSRDTAVLITSGAINAFDALLRAHLTPGDEVLVPDPGFPPYHSVVRLAGGRPVPYALRPAPDGRGFALDLDDLAGKLNARTRFLVLNSPHNPTGHVLGDDELRGVAELLDAHPQVAYISDEVYARLVYDGAAAQSIAALSPTGVVIDSLSKSHGLAGYRVGWLYGDRRLVHGARAVLADTLGCVSSISQELAKTALRRGPGAGPGVSALAASCAAARTAAMELLDRQQLGYAVPRGGIYLFVAHGGALGGAPGGDGPAVGRALAAAGVQVVPGDAFGSGGRGWLRTTFAVPDGELVAGFTRLGQTLAPQAQATQEAQRPQEPQRRSPPCRVSSSTR